MSINSQLLGLFVEELYSVESLQDRFKVYGKYIELLHFEGATYTLLPKIPMSDKPCMSPIFEKTDSFSIEFLDHYMQEGLDQQDFTIRKGNEMCTTPMDWREHERHKQITAQENEVITLAREDYDITNALTIPTMNNSLVMSGMTIISTEKDRLFNKIKEENLDTLFLFSKIFHDAVLAKTPHLHEFLPNSLLHFSEKEKSVLKFVLSGKPMKLLYNETGISVRYGEKVLAKLRKKFGNVSTIQLSYYVGLFKLIDSL